MTRAHVICNKKWKGIMNLDYQKTTIPNPLPESTLVLTYDTSHDARLRD